MRSIIFDLDDTLYIGKELRAARNEAIVRLIGNKKDEFSRHKKNLTTTESLIKIGISRDEFFSTLKNVPISLQRDEELYLMLERLKKDHRLIVISNSPTECVRETLFQLGILHLFDAFYGAENFSKSKPSEECFSLVQKGDICIGDDFKKDLEIPKQKGAITVLVNSILEGNPDFTIETIYDLEKVIENINSN